MLWSILIATVPSRAQKLFNLISNLEKQIGNYWTIEIVSILDNKVRTVGEKRNQLIDIAKGDYISFIDDDDTISDSYIEDIKQALVFMPDVVTFDVLCTVGKQQKLCHYGIEYKGFRCKMLGNGDEEWFARPYHLHVWRKDLVPRFPDISLGEDVIWADSIDVKDLRQEKINKILYYYQYDEKNTEIKGRQ